MLKLKGKRHRQCRAWQLLLQVAPMREERALCLPASHRCRAQFSFHFIMAQQIDSERQSARIRGEVQCWHCGYAFKNGPPPLRCPKCKKAVSEPTPEIRLLCLLLPPAALFVAYGKNRYSMRSAPECGMDALIWGGTGLVVYTCALVVAHVVFDVHFHVLSFMRS